VSVPPEKNGHQQKNGPMARALRLRLERGAGAPGMPGWSSSRPSGAGRGSGRGRGCGCGGPGGGLGGSGGGL